MARVLDQSAVNWLAAAVRRMDGRLNTFAGKIEVLEEKVSVLEATTTTNCGPLSVSATATTTVAAEDWRDVDADEDIDAFLKCCGGKPRVLGLQRSDASTAPTDGAGADVQQAVVAATALAVSVLPSSLPLELDRRTISSTASLSCVAEVDEEEKEEEVEEEDEHVGAEGVKNRIRWKTESSEDEEDEEEFAEQQAYEDFVKETNSSIDAECSGAGRMAHGDFAQEPNSPIDAACSGARQAYEDFAKESNASIEAVCSGAGQASEDFAKETNSSVDAEAAELEKSLSALAEAQAEMDQIRLEEKGKQNFGNGNAFTPDWCTARLHTLKCEIKRLQPGKARDTKLEEWAYLCEWLDENT